MMFGRKTIKYIYFCMYRQLVLFALLLVFFFSHISEAFSDGQIPEAILPVHEFCGGSAWPGVVWWHPHENETTSRQMAQQILTDKQQGCLLSLQHGGSRNIIVHQGTMTYQFDPNRIFTPEGRMQTLVCLSAQCQPALLQLKTAVDAFVQAYLTPARLIVALHNNKVGGLSLKNYDAGGHMSGSVSQLVRAAQAHDDDFFYVTTQQAFQFFARRRFNVVLQDNLHVQNDGSLSVWAAGHQVDYINVEAGIHHPEVQMAMLQAVWAYMDQYYPTAS